MISNLIFVRREILVNSTGTPVQFPNVTFNPPSPLIAFLPPEVITSKVNLKVTNAFDTYRGENIILLPWHIYSSESVREAHAVVSVEKHSSREFISTSNGIAVVDPPNGVCVIPPTIAILKELAEIVEMETGAESIPAWKSPSRIRTT